MQSLISDKANCKTNGKRLWKTNVGVHIRTASGGANLHTAIKASRLSTLHVQLIGRRTQCESTSRQQAGQMARLRTGEPGQ